MFKFETRMCGSCGQSWQALDFWDEASVCHDCSTARYEEHLREINDGRAYRVASIGGACPTQAEGTLPDGRYYYFRARHGWWTLETGPDAESAVGGDLLAEGEDGSGGWMRHAEVLAILDEHLAPRP